MTSYTNPDALVSTEWLAEHINAPDVRVVDASFYLPAENRNARQEYEDCHIPGAVFFDIDEICDTDSDLPHMLPSPEKFSSRVRRLGLGDGNRIVVYDGWGIRSAPRVWWMFRAFGHGDVAVLDGGLPKWREEGRAVSDMPPVPRERHFTARLNTTMVRDYSHVLRNIDRKKEQVLDARSAGRFSGSDPEPRPGMRGGHIPGSVNLPYTDLLRKEDRTMLDADGLRAALAGIGFDSHRPVVTTCGSGVTASVIALALHLLGHREVAVYDGSWSEWGMREDAPIET